MATRNIVPRADVEGCIGTESKKWQSVNTKKVNAESVNSIGATIEKVSATTITSTDLTIINGITTLQRNKAYEVGDIAYSKNLPSWAYLECITAGTTGNEEPDFSSVSTSGGAIADMTAGAVHWRVIDTRCRYEVGDIIAKTTTPKSYEYLLPCDGSAFDTNKYPMLAKIFTTGKVPNLTDGRFLEGSISAGTSKNAGLPNITGDFGKIYTYSDQISVSGAFSAKKGNTNSGPNSQGSGSYTSVVYDFDASKFNNIYGASNTVQPKSYNVVYSLCYGG